MRLYDPGQPLISLHVPKCAGQSMRSLLEGWFGSQLRLHYRNRQSPPVIQPMDPGLCIHGHFNIERNSGVDSSYPRAPQFITVLRDPLEMALSNYFYWKQKARVLQIAEGRLQAGSEHDYRDIDDFFAKRPRSAMLNFLPQAMADGNYATVIQERFVWIGTVERLDDRAGNLASRLGFIETPIPHLNDAVRDETLSPSLQKDFQEASWYEQELYDYVRSLEDDESYS